MSCRATRVPVWLSCLLALVQGQLFPVSVRHPPGVDVSAPRLVAGNGTWQFDVLLLAAGGALLVPLFTDRDAPTGPPLGSCEGFVSICCLDTLAANFLNERFASYVADLGVHADGTGACPAGASSRDVLAGWPPADALQTGAFAVSPRAWCAAPHHCTYELTIAQMRNPRLTEDLGVSSDLNGWVVTDRRLEVVVAIAVPTTTPRVQLTLSHHTLLFHDSDTPPPVDPNFRHHAFSHVCRDFEKPEHALWRADVLARDGTCLWFCAPGFALHPATTDAGLLAATRPYACAREPTRATVLSADVSVRLAAAAGVDPDVYYAEAITALEVALALPPGATVFHLQEVQANGTLRVSIALFVAECPRNHSALEARVAEMLRDAVARFSEALGDALNATATAPNATGPGVESLLVHGVETVAHCPSAVPLYLIVVAAVWAALLCVFCAYGARAAVRRARERRSRILRSLGPVAQPAFRARL